MFTPEETFFKIILADDEVHYRNIVASRLRQERFTVEVATGGFHLLHLLESSPRWSMVIIHNDMKDMSAHEIISLARNIKPKTELPILFVADESNQDQLEVMMASGANEYALKSQNLQPIVDKVRKYMSLLKKS